MGWADNHVQALKEGKAVSFRPHGNSMADKVESGQLCTVEPLKEAPEKGDIVLCKVKGRQYLHLVKAVKGGRFQIGNNKGRINGWVGLASIYGKLSRVE